MMEETGWIVVTTLGWPSPLNSEPLFLRPNSTFLDDLEGVVTPRILNSTNCGLSALPTVDEIEFVVKEMNPRAG